MRGEVETPSVAQRGRNGREEIDEQREAGKTQPRAASNSFPSGEGGSAPRALTEGVSRVRGDAWRGGDPLRRPEGDTPLKGRNRKESESYEPAEGRSTRPIPSPQGKVAAPPGADGRGLSRAWRCVERWRPPPSPRGRHLPLKGRNCRGSESHGGLVPQAGIEPSPRPARSVGR